ncbi:hypothetical protein AOQ84DRAFT_200884 [Glonium stellatum]|uniref:Uncharacterized protein n=1 Tax=Glonium stellatum TaxID=574774 RepID=A0A8E2F634_9PEZI|nr:hypothetical protein AOQ84DRAFT_200884 [Glonium stellatum]
MGSLQLHCILGMLACFRHISSLPFSRLRLYVLPHTPFYLQNLINNSWIVPLLFAG